MQIALQDECLDDSIPVVEVLGGQGQAGRDSFGGTVGYSCRQLHFFSHAMPDDADMTATFLPALNGFVGSEAAQLVGSGTLPASY